MDKWTQERFASLDNKRYILNDWREMIGGFLYNKELEEEDFERDYNIVNNLIEIGRVLLNHYEEYDLDTIENVKDLIENQNIQNYVLLLDSAIERIDKEIENL